MAFLLLLSISIWLSLHGCAVDRQCPCCPRRDRKDLGQGNEGRWEGGDWRREVVFSSSSPCVSVCHGPSPTPTPPPDVTCLCLVVVCLLAVTSCGMPRSLSITCGMKKNILAHSCILLSCIAPCVWREKDIAALLVHFRPAWIFLLVLCINRSSDDSNLHCPYAAQTLLLLHCLLVRARHVLPHPSF